MKRYKIYYEAPPVSEVVKIVYIEAKSGKEAIDDFNGCEIAGAKIIGIIEDGSTP